MTELLRVEPGTPLALSRGDAAVCIPVYGAALLFARCLESVLEHTPKEVAVLVADDCTPEADIAGLVADLVKRFNRDVYLLRQPRNLGFVANVNSCFDMTAPADVVILNSDCEVARNWFDDLRAAAYSDTIVATATAFTNNGALVSVPERNHGLPGLPSGWTLSAAAAAIRAAALRLRPHLPSMVGHCSYIKRSAIELVGDFDIAFSPGYGEEVDFSQRCLLRGLANVAADDVFVLHHGSASFAATDGSARIRHEHELLVGRRYPYYHDAVRAAETSRSSPLARSISAACRALNGLSVTIDGSCLTDAQNGTQVHTLEIIQALHRSGGARLRVALPRRCTPYVRGILRSLDGLEVLDIERVDQRTSRSDIVHRPYQVGRLHELVRLRQLGERVVVTQQDFIAYRNPGHFDDFREWYRYRQLARATLAQAERVVFFSKHAACEAIAEGLVDEERSRVAYIGVDHHHTRQTQEQRRPAMPQGVERDGLLVCLGVDFMHKNRLFALRVLEQLQTRHGWRGHLVFAGPQASPGSSADEVLAFLGAHARVAAATTIFGRVTEEEKWWLLANASLVMSPSTYEGFGLLPFEAAEAGTPSLFARQASLAEVLPAESALIEPWDPVQGADRAMRLMTEPAEARQVLTSIQTAASRYSWDRTATALLKIYSEAAEAVPRDLVVELAAHMDGRRGGSMLREPTIEFAKVVRFWRTYGFLQGSLRGSGALAGRLRRRVKSAVGAISNPKD